MATAAPSRPRRGRCRQPSTDIQAQDQEANTVTPTVGSTSVALPVVAAWLGTSRRSSRKLRPNGVLTVQTEAHPVSNIVVANSAPGLPRPLYRAVAQFEDVEIDRIGVFASSTIATNADNADYAEVAIASGNAVKGMNQLSSGATGTRIIGFTTGEIVVPKDGNVTFEIWGQMRPSPSSTNAATSGLPRSGHLPAIGPVRPHDERVGCQLREQPQHPFPRSGFGRASLRRHGQATHGNVMKVAQGGWSSPNGSLSTTLSNTT